jgi:DNA polymerase III sliding clamp (beta) subunit (PCNA family)
MNLEGRYPDYQPLIPEKQKALAFISETRILIE